MSTFPLWLTRNPPPLPLPEGGDRGVLETGVASAVFGVGVSRNEFLPSVQRVLSPFVSEAFRNDWQIRLWRLTKCLWILRADHLTFGLVMGDFRKKCPADWFPEENSMQINSWKKNILHWKNIAHDVQRWKKILHCYVLGKTFLTPETFGKKLFQYKLNQ